MMKNKKIILKYLRYLSIVFTVVSCLFCLITYIMYIHFINDLNNYYLLAFLANIILLLRCVVFSIPYMFINYYYKKINK